MARSEEGNVDPINQTRAQLARLGQSELKNVAVRLLGAEVPPEASKEDLLKLVLGFLEQLEEIDRNELADAAARLCGGKPPRHASSRDLVRRILGCITLRPELHLAPVTGLERLIRDEAREQRFADQVEPLTKTTSKIQSVFISIGTAATVIVGVSTLFGYNLHTDLKEQHAALKQQQELVEKNRDVLEEELRDLEKVTAEIRRDRRDEVRRAAALERFILQDEIFQFQTAFKSMISRSLEFGSEKVQAELEAIKPDVARWKKLVGLRGVMLETKREMKWIETQIDFIDAMEHNAMISAGEPAQWSRARAAWVALKPKLARLEKSDADNIGELYELLRTADQALDSAATAEKFSDQDGEDLKVQMQNRQRTLNLTLELKSRLKSWSTHLGDLRLAAEEQDIDFSGLIATMLSYTEVILARLERTQSTPDLEKAIAHARDAVRWDSAYVQARGELARAYRAMARAKYRAEDTHGVSLNYDRATKATWIPLGAEDGTGLKPQDELILANNTAFTNLEWAGYAENREQAAVRVEDGLHALRNLRDPKFSGLGMARDIALLTKAELLIARLSLEIAPDFNSLAAAWRNKKCLSFADTLSNLLEKKVSEVQEDTEDRTESVAEEARAQRSTQSEQACSTAYDRVNEILGYMDDAVEFGKTFYRGNREQELQRKSPYLCSFAKLDLVEDVDATADLAPEQVMQERARDLRTLEKKRDSMFLLEPDTGAPPATGAAPAGE
jgi:hypothetical protein